MKVRIRTTWILRSTAFFAIGAWALTWPRSYPHMFAHTLWIAPAAFGGAIGALFGKTPHGVFCGLALFALLIGAGVVWILATGLPVD